MCVVVIVMLLLWCVNGVLIFGKMFEIVLFECLCCVIIEMQFELSK